MTTIKISNLPPAAAVTDSTIIPVVDSGANKKITGAQIKTYIAANGGVGATGVRGPAGYTGSEGVGATGATGATGAIGARGYTGSQGVAGPSGSAGGPGATGGLGYTGSIGLTGASGVSGAIGATGISGTVGYTGSAGPQGASGMRGDTGYVGSQGIAGAAGAAGATGASGPGFVWRGDWNPSGSYIGGQDVVSYDGGSYIKIGNGNSGSAPPDDPVRWGVVADSGSTGATGPKGNDGTGVTILGSYADLTALSAAQPTGSAGEAYILTNTGHLAVWTGTQWNDVGSIQGPQGDVGATGPQGDVGANGADALWNWQGAYDAAPMYQEGDIVSYLGSTYRRNNAGNSVVGEPPTNATYWQIVAQRGEDGTGGGTGDRLVNGVNSVVLNSDGSTTFPGTLNVAGGDATSITGADGVKISATEGKQLMLDWQAAAVNPYPGLPQLSTTVALVNMDYNGVSIEVNNAEGGGYWTFGPNGKLRLPIDGDIVNTDGNTVLHSGAELVGDSVAGAGSKLDIATGSAYGNTAVSIASNTTLVSTYLPGGTITFQDGEVRTITQIDDYPGGTDIFWNTAKTGTLFPITLKTANYAAATISARITVDTHQWTFGEDGSTTLPSGQPLLFGNGNSRIQAGMGFHINSEEGISLESVNVADPANPVSYGWYFGTDGNLTLPQTDFNSSPAPISWPGITFSDGTFQNTATGGGVPLAVSTGPGNVFENVTGILFNGDNFTVTDAGGNPYISAIGGGTGQSIGFYFNGGVANTPGTGVILDGGGASTTANITISAGVATETYTENILSPVAITGDYNDLVNTPTPTPTTGGPIASNGVSCLPNATTVVYTGVSRYASTIKLLVLVEGFDGTNTSWDTQSCEIVVAKSVRNNLVAASVYGLVYTSTTPLATFNAVWNATTLRVDVTCVPTSTTNDVVVRTIATEITTSD